MCTHHDLLQIFAEEHKTSTCVAPENNLESTQNQSPLYLSWLLHVVLILLLFLLHPYAIAAVGQHKAIKSPTTNTCRWEMMIRSLPLWPQHRRRRSQTQLQQRADGRYIIVPDSAERPIIVPDSADRPIIMPVHADRHIVVPVGVSLCRRRSMRWKIKWDYSTNGNISPSQDGQKGGKPPFPSSLVKTQKTAS